MAMSLCGARLAVPDRVLRRAIPSRVAQLVIRPGVLQLHVIRPSAARASTPASVRMQAFWNQQPEAPAPVPAASWLAELNMAVGTFLGICLTAFGLYILLRGVIIDSFNASSKELTYTLDANSKEPNTKLDTSSKELTYKLDANSKELTYKLDAINDKLDTISKDVAALSADVRAQSRQTSIMQGKVDVLQGMVTR